MLIIKGPGRAPKSGLPAKQLVVVLHGYGADGENLLDLCDYWSSFLPEAAFLAPNGLEPCEISPLGYQWFGLKDLNLFNIRQGLDKATPQVAENILDTLNALSLTPQDLCLVGFSQGAMISLDLMFHIQGLRAVVGYSGAFYPPVGKVLTSSLPAVMLIHGTLDTVVPYVALQESERFLDKFNIKPKILSCHGLSHSISLEGLKEGALFAREAFGLPPLKTENY